MNVAVMGVGPVNVLMCHPFMHMVMIVWLHGVFPFVRMPMMFILIMSVLMPMCNSLMDMGMFVSLPIKAQNTCKHQ
jgi:hypothetical protein